MIMAILLAHNLIKEAEGFSATEYICPAGYPSIGYGRNLKFYPLANDEKREMVMNGLGEPSVSTLLASKWLEKEVDEIYQDVKKEDYFNGLGDERQAVVIDMIYNLGLAKFRTFKKFIQALKDKDFDKASYEIEHGSAPNGKSHYWNQVGIRAKRNAQIIKTGLDNWDFYNNCERI